MIGRYDINPAAMGVDMVLAEGHNLSDQSNRTVTRPLSGPTWRQYDCPFRQYCGVIDRMTRAVGHSRRDDSARCFSLSIRVVSIKQWQRVPQAYVAPRWLLSTRIYILARNITFVAQGVIGTQV